MAEWVRGYTYRVAGGQKTIKSGYHPGRHLHHFTFLLPLSPAPFYPSPFSRTFHFGLRTAGASLSIQFRSHLCTWGPASVHTCRRTYGGTSYLFYFIVSRSHPQAWVNIFLRDRAPTHPPLPVHAYHPLFPHSGCFSFQIVVSATPPPLVTSLFSTVPRLCWYREPGGAYATRRRTCNFEVRGGGLWKIATRNY